MMHLNWTTCTRILNTYKRFILREALLFLFIFLGVYSIALGQWVSQNRICTSSLRGLSVVDDNIVWASGSDGTWLRTCEPPSYID